MKKHEASIDIPMPSEKLRQEAAASKATIQVEEIPQAQGHFAVEHRRC